MMKHLKPAWQAGSYYIIFKIYVHLALHFFHKSCQLCRCVHKGMKSIAWVIFRWQKCHFLILAVCKVVWYFGLDNFHAAPEFCRVSNTRTCVHMHTRTHTHRASIYHMSINLTDSQLWKILLYIRTWKSIREERFGHTKCHDRCLSLNCSFYISRNIEHS